MSDNHNANLIADKMDCRPEVLKTQETPVESAQAEQFSEGQLSSEQLKELGKLYSLTFIDNISEYAFYEGFINKIPISYARQKAVLALRQNSGVVLIACCNPHQLSIIDDIALILGCPVEMVLTPREQILKAINNAYEHRSAIVEQIIDQIDPEEIAEQVERLGAGDDLLDVASRTPVIKLVNMILFEAAKVHASDVHLQPYEECMQIRFRIDGILYNKLTIPCRLHDAVCSRIKVMGKMNIAERRLAQDGRASVQIGDKIVDLRISSLPTSYGERIVVRLLDKSTSLHDLSEIGMSDDMLVNFKNLIKSSHGIILVTGPTGSGKTTTLYAALQLLDTGQKNILTLEDPIEYQLRGISQTQVSEKKGMTFASGLRYVLRQDPDVIMVGEIRDQPTARMAIQSSLTGHLVFSTLHTNDSVSAVARMLDLGIEPYLVASSVVGVLAQRLVRKICLKCRVEYEPNWSSADEKLIPENFRKVDKLYRGLGCDNCLNTGYSGRTGIFELLEVNTSIRELIHNYSQTDKIRKTAIDQGLITLRMDGFTKAAKGFTDIEEVLRVTQSDRVDL